MRWRSPPSTLGAAWLSGDLAHGTLASTARVSSIVHTHHYPADITRLQALIPGCGNCRSGADKVSIGSDAVDVVQEMQRTGERTGSSSIEQISWHYGAQAMVVSIDPRRVYISDPAECSHQCVRTSIPGARTTITAAACSNLACRAWPRPDGNARQYVNLNLYQWRADFLRVNALCNAEAST